MKVTDYTRTELKLRRHMREMTAKGYERINGPWDIFRGSRYRHRIVDAIVDLTGRNVWVKLEEPTKRYVSY